MQNEEREYANQLWKMYLMLYWFKNFSIGEAIKKKEQKRQPQIESVNIDCLQ